MTSAFELSFCILCAFAMSLCADGILMIFFISGNSSSSIFAVFVWLFGAQIFFKSCPLYIQECMTDKASCSIGYDTKKPSADSLFLFVPLDSASLICFLQNVIYGRVSFSPSLD